MTDLLPQRFASFGLRRPRVGWLLAGSLMVAVWLAGASPQDARAAEPLPSPTPAPATRAAPPPPDPSGDVGTPRPTLAPRPIATPAPSLPPPPPAPASLSVYDADGFRFQDPNPYACTSTTVMDTLNFIALGKLGGSGFRWNVSLSGATRDSILAWEQTHDTLDGGNGSDPHGIRNALNHYGWGSAALWAGSRVYDDFAYASYDEAIKSAVRSMAIHRKPVAILSWRGRHVQMLTGYYGLNGDPHARDAAGRYTNSFSVAGVYLTDPLRSDGYVHRGISYAALKTTTNLKLRFQPYYETDSPWDDAYTAGYRRARDEWYGKFVIVAPVR